MPADIEQYMGGNILLVHTTSSHALDTSKTVQPLAFPYVYKDTTAPNPDRQDTPHPHQIIEGPDGEIIVPDLGNDRVWILHRDSKEETGLKIVGYYQAPAGSGPRHGVVSKDGQPFQARLQADC